MGRVLHGAHALVGGGVARAPALEVVAGVELAQARLARKRALPLEAAAGRAHHREPAACEDRNGRITADDAARGRAAHESITRRGTFAARPPVASARLLSIEASTSPGRMPVMQRACANQHESTLLSCTNMQGEQASAR